MRHKVLPFQLFLYRQILLAYPADLRVRFGSDMLEIFEDLLRDSSSHSGFSGELSVWGDAGRELLTVALPARLQSARWSAAAISFLISSFIAWIFFRSVG